MCIRFGQIEFDERRFLLQRDGVRLRVRPKVFDLLSHLIRNRERVVLREELIMALWGTTAVGLGSLSGLVNELRQVLGEAGRGPSSIRTVHARGYQFVARIEEPDFAKSSPAGRVLDPINGDGHGDGHGVTIASRPCKYAATVGAIRMSCSRVPTVGARAVIVVGLPGSGRSDLLDLASAEIALAGLEIHRLRVGNRSERRPNALVDRLINTLVERYGIDAIRSAIPVRASELLERIERIGGAEMGMPSNARPRDPFASRQYDERVWRSAAELLRELARQRPLALIVDDRDQTVTAASLAVSYLLRLLGRAPVFVLCTSAVGETGSDLSEVIEPGIEFVRLPSLDRRQLNELLESRGIAALPVPLADALVAHVRNDEVSLESITGWLRTEKGNVERIPDELVRPSLDRRMKRVEPDTTARRSRFGRS